MPDRSTPEQSQAGRPARIRGGARKFVAPAMVVGCAVGAALLIGYLVSEVFADPTSPLYRAFLTAAQLTIPNADSDNKEYLVFLRENNEINRLRVATTVANVRFVANSVLPGVVVVEFPEGPGEALAALRKLDFVRMIVKYNPVFVCH